MKRKPLDPSTRRDASAGLRREQALCVAALASGEYDNMTDKEWVAMCERIAHGQPGSSSPDQHKSVIEQPG